MIFSFFFENDFILIWTKFSLVIFSDVCELTYTCINIINQKIYYFMFLLIGFLTIGIPTVCRGKHQYILSTLDSVVSGMSRGQRYEVFIIIYLADRDRLCRQNTEKEIRDTFSSYVRTCLIRFVNPPDEPEFYPQINSLYQIESEKKQIWRTKQNLDFGFLLLQCKNLSTYYLQLEDDVIAADSFYRVIKDTVIQRVTHWVCMEFIELGFIGKLFRSRDLESLAGMIVDWAEHTPADDTYIEFYKRRKQKARILITPTLFQHVGVHSSLQGRLQTLKDPYFEGDFQNKKFVHRNPPAKINTSMAIDFQHLPRHCYEGSRGYFLTSAPVFKEDVFYLLFLSLQNLSKIYVQTGLGVGKGNILREGVLEIGGHFECANKVFKDVVKFHKGLVNVIVNKKDVLCIQIRVTANQDTLLMIKEISIFSV